MENTNNFYILFGLFTPRKEIVSFPILHPPNWTNGLWLARATYCKLLLRGTQKKEFPGRLGLVDFILMLICLAHSILCVVFVCFSTVQKREETNFSVYYLGLFCICCPNGWNPSAGSAIWFALLLGKSTCTNKEQQD